MERIKRQMAGDEAQSSEEEPVEEKGGSREKGPQATEGQDSAGGPTEGKQAEEVIEERQQDGLKVDVVVENGEAPQLDSPSKPRSTNELASPELKKGLSQSTPW